MSSGQARWADDQDSLSFWQARLESCQSSKARCEEAIAELQLYKAYEGSKFISSAIADGMRNWNRRLSEISSDIKDCEYNIRRLSK